MASGKASCSAARSPHHLKRLNHEMLMPLARVAGAALAVFVIYVLPPQVLIRVAHRMPAGIDPFFLLFTLQVMVFASIATLLRVPLPSLVRTGLSAFGLRGVLWLWSGGILLALFASISAVSTSSSTSGFLVTDGLEALARGFSNSGITGALLQRGFFMPVLEEFLFRVLILGFLLRTMKPWLALLISAALFATGHSSWLVSGFMGIAFGLLYLRYRSAWLCIVAHAGHNLLVALGAPLLVAYLHERNMLFPVQHNLLALQIAWFVVAAACFWMFFRHVLVGAGRGGPSVLAPQST